MASRDRKSVYPWWSDAKWNAITPLVKERDGYACTACGSEGDDTKVNPLTVDHIKPLKHFDEYDIENDLAYDPDNLETLCNYCNGRKQDSIRVRHSWTEEEWFEEPGDTVPFF